MVTSDHRGETMKHLWPYHKDALALGLGAFFIYVGILHFIDVNGSHQLYLKLFHSAEFWVIISGIPEVLCGIGLILRPTRAIAGKATVALLIVLYWANLNMWINDIPLSGNTFPLWARHILRALCAAW